MQAGLAQDDLTEIGPRAVSQEPMVHFLRLIINSLALQHLVVYHSEPRVLVQLWRHRL